MVAGHQSALSVLRLRLPPLIFSAFQLFRFFLFSSAKFPAHNSSMLTLLAVDRETLNVINPFQNIFTASMTNQSPNDVLAQVNETVMGRVYTHFSAHGSSTTTRLLLIVATGRGRSCAGPDCPGHQRMAHLQEPRAEKSARVCDAAAQIHHRVAADCQRRHLCHLFFCGRPVLQELGVNLTAYLASASIIGLAISFGSQGLVQDIVAGLTLISSDAMDVGDLVEIAGTVVVIGRVEEIGLRFTRMVNFLNQQVLIPNRTIANVSRFPRGGVDAYGDVQIPAGADREKSAPLSGRSPTACGRSLARSF